MRSRLTHLECSACEKRLDAEKLWTLCPGCGRPLLARYDLSPGVLDRDAVAARPGRMWRWREILPVQDPAHIANLGAGDTPLLHARRLGEALGMPALYVKDEGANPTGSFKARGLAMAVSRAVELGARALVMPTAGNAGGAMAAYAARAGVEAHIYMPADSPPVNVIECRVAGAHLTLVDGLISDAGRLAAAEGEANGWFNLSTLKEPYRLEGKKIMGVELARDFDWTLPDVVVYPTGGGTGLIGMWKAFDEMAQLGWIGAERPRMVCVQASGCAPMVRAFESGAEQAEPWQDAHTIASGLRVPGAVGDRLILRALYESGGTAVAVSDDAIMAAQRRLASSEGIFAAPEGAATLAALEKLLESGWVTPDARVVLFNTGTGLKYTHLL